VAVFLIQLLETGKKVDFEIAMRLVPALGTRHRSGERLSQAISAATKKLKVTVPKGVEKGLKAAKVKLPKQSLTSRARGIFRLKSVCARNVDRVLRQLLRDDLHELMPYRA
jgi:hypothetical protein